MSSNASLFQISNVQDPNDNAGVSLYAHDSLSSLESADAKRGASLQSSSFLNYPLPALTIVADIHNVPLRLVDLDAPKKVVFQRQ